MAARRRQSLGTSRRRARRRRRRGADLRRREWRDLPRRAERTMTRHRTRFAVLACGALACLAGPARAQATPPSLTGSSYRPGVDVLDYDVRLELPDSGLFLRGDVTVTARHAPSLATLRLDLIDSLTVRSVEVDGRHV